MMLGQQPQLPERDRSPEEPPGLRQPSMDNHVKRSPRLSRGGLAHPMNHSTSAAPSFGLFEGWELDTLPANV